LRKQPSAGQSLLLGLGLVILANSRPYEGFVFAIPVAIAMLTWLKGTERPRLRRVVRRVILPLAAILLLGGLATGWYYHQVTGSAFRLAYQINRAQYATAPYFVWQDPSPEPAYRHAVLRDYYQQELNEFLLNRTCAGYLQRAAAKIAHWWQFYLGPLMTVPMFALPWVVRQRKMMLPVLICGAMAAGSALQTWTFPHYFAPATGALYILLMQGFRDLRLWRRQTGVGRAIARAVPLLACAMILIRLTAVATHTQIEPEWPRGNLKRAAVLRQLRQRDGEHLVIVRYGPGHDLHRYWVWNEANIDAAKVVWARDMGADANRELISYFADRRAWQINADDHSPRIEPYSADARK